MLSQQKWKVPFIYDEVAFQSILQKTKLRPREITLSVIPFQSVATLEHPQLPCELMAVEPREGHREVQLQLVLEAGAPQSYDEMPGLKKKKKNTNMNFMEVMC